MARPSTTPNESHKMEHTWGVAEKCSRCGMCTCHSLHKLLEECERIDGRVKV